MGHWLEVARNGNHPFVAEAGKLAVEALKTRHPERFLWIDESGIVSSVGSRAAQATKDRKHHLWIPPSAGWAALDPRAQQLVADVLLLLNLAERGEGPDEIERRLRRVEGSDLPLCFTRNRDPLDPKTTVGGLSRAPGSNCIDGCAIPSVSVPAGWSSAVPIRAERSLLPGSADAGEQGPVGSVADDPPGQSKALLGADGRTGARREHGSRSRLIPGSPTYLEAEQPWTSPAVDYDAELRFDPT